MQSFAKPYDRSMAQGRPAKGLRKDRLSGLFRSIADQRRSALLARVAKKQGRPHGVPATPEFAKTAYGRISFGHLTRCPSL
jgi:hypothetical protein